MRISHDKGHGSDLGSFLYITFGRVGLRKWWMNLNRGPGNAMGPGPYRGQRCGHKFPAHCNSAFCGAFWCGAQSWPIFGFLFVIGHSLRIWTGPTYHRGSVREWLRGLRNLARKRRTYPGDRLYRLISL